jgi:putative transposon-encoded protein
MYQVIEKTVKSSGNSGRVYVPKEWVGKKVKILLMEPLETNK